MYCYTYVNQFACIFNELELWTHISSEHPTFLKTQALSFYPELLEFGKENKVWQELVNHIIHEQNFMLELFKNLILQIG